MQKAVLFTLLFINIYTYASTGPDSDVYKATIDLIAVENDKVQITIHVPEISTDEIVYCLPKIVPGTYSIYDFGRFVSDFKALDENNNLLKVEKISENEWKIFDATVLNKINYWVDDTYDMTQSNPIFEPAGTNIAPGKNFVVNSFGFIGYLEGLKSLRYELTIKKPAEFYGVTPLRSSHTADSYDIFHLHNYDHLADSPIMYGLPDTAIKVVGGADVLIGVYSPNKIITASQIMDNVKEILEASEDYLGGKLPVDKYAFLFYFTDTAGVSGGMGALEHKNSSVYFLPEMPINEIATTLRDVCAHEFFHVVTPLNIHSEEIADFNFIEPDMSKHLWLYEGQTEYAAHHAQVRGGLISPQEFIERLQEKIFTSQNYYNDTLPFTLMSEGCLNHYHSEYGNVYQKGALINMCLDIELLRLSGGTYGTPELMRELGEKFGQQKAFEDNALFDIIAEMTYPEIRTFFKLYVEGSNSLPYQKFFNYAGIEMSQSEVMKMLSLGNVAFNFDASPSGTFITVADTTGMNSFGRDLGYIPGDRIVQIDNIDFTSGNPNELVQQWKNQTSAGDKVKMIVTRKGSSDTEKKVKLKAKALEVEVKMPGKYLLAINPTAEQEKLRKAWLGN